MKRIKFIPIRLLLILFLASFASAQNAGNTGTFTSAQQLFLNQATNQSSVIVNNIGQAAHYLMYCNSGFTGSIDIEASYSGTAFWVPIATASYSVVDGSCHILQAGGYYQYVRSTAIVTAGNVSAWYSSSSGPITFAAPGTGSTGPASPVVCDSNITISITNTFTALIALASLRTIAVCGYVISLDAAAVSTGVMSFAQATGGSNCIAGLTGANWSIDTTANTPQVVSFGDGQGSIFRTFQTQDLCFTNNSGANIKIAVSYARL